MNIAQTVYLQNSCVSQAYVADIVDEATKKFKIPAIAICVMNAKTIYLEKIQGVRVMDKTALATLDDYFHIGSCSKSVLAVMAAKLVEQDKISWDTRFFDLFPELLGNANDAYLEITLEDLMLSRAGIKAFTNAAKEQFPAYESSEPDKRLAFIKYLLEQPPSTKKKNGKFLHLYSNPSYMMASAMLERVTSLSYEEMVQKFVVEDLGLPIHIGWPNRMSDDQPWGHMIHKGKIEVFPPDHPYQIPYLVTPAGDLSMTPKDYAKYTQMHLQGLRGKKNFLASQSYQYMHFGHKGFSLGVFNSRFAGFNFSGFDGSAGTFYCRSIIVPESDFAFTIMTNVGSSKGKVNAVEWLTRKIVSKHFNLKWWQKFLLWI